MYDLSAIEKAYARTFVNQPLPKPYRKMTGEGA